MIECLNISHLLLSMVLSVYAGVCAGVCLCVYVCGPEEAHFVLMVLIFKLSPMLVLNVQHKFLCIVVIQSAFCVHIS